MLAFPAASTEGREDIFAVLSTPRFIGENDALVKYFLQFQGECEMYRQAGDPPPIDHAEMDAGRRIVERLKYWRERARSVPVSATRIPFAREADESPEGVERGLRFCAWERWQREWPVLARELAGQNDEVFQYLNVRRSDLQPPLKRSYNPPDDWSRDLDVRVHYALKRWREMSGKSRNAIPEVMAARREEVWRARLEERLAALEKAAGIGENHHELQG